jgi:hypothetical protein
LFDRFSNHQLEVIGRGGLIQARVLKLKKAVKGDANAREVSDALPFLGMVISKPTFQFILIYFFKLFSLLWIGMPIRSVVDPGCLSGVRIFPARNQGQKDYGSRIRIRINELSIFSPKNCF